MKAPMRLLDSNDAAVRELLLAGARERPRARALRTTALSLGVSSSVMAASTTATATLAVGSGSALASASQSIGLLAAKWLAIGTLGGLALGGSAWVVTGAAPQQQATSPLPSVQAAGPAPRTSAVAAATESAPESGEQASAPRSAESAPGLAESSKQVASPHRSVASSGVTQRGNAKPSPPLAATPAASGSLPAAQSLSREIAMIDGARRALAAGDAVAALQTLDTYQATARTGTLDREAQLLRIDALSQSGRREAAQALAQRYLASYPNDPHAARLQALSGTP